MSMRSRYAQNPDAIDHLVLECAAHGYSRAQIAACLGVSYQTLGLWVKNHPRFADVMERALTLSQAWWEGRAMDGTANSLIGQTVWSKSIAARFPEDYAERQEIGGIGEVARSIKWRVVDPEGET